MDKMRTYEMKRKAVLTIAGSDCSGGAGIQADLKTMLANDVYGMAAVTALTAQNTTGVKGICQVGAEFLRQQLEAVFQDIFPDAVKIGMLFSADMVSVTAEILRRERPGNIVLDPVMVSSSGRPLLKEDAAQRLTKELFPQADLLTPNIPEAEVLLGCAITGPSSAEGAARALSQRYGTSVLLKGGHGGEGADDFLWHKGTGVWFKGERVSNPNSHGTGCTLSSAIASNLAKGLAMEESVKKAKTYLTGALAAGLDMGKGSGPLDHGFAFGIPRLG